MKTLVLRVFAILVAAMLVGPSVAAASNNTSNPVSKSGNTYYVTLPGYFSEKIYQPPYLEVYDTFVVTVTEPLVNLRVSIDVSFYCFEGVYLIVVVDRPNSHDLYFVSGFPYCGREWSRTYFYKTGTYILYVSVYDTAAVFVADHPGYPYYVEFSAYPFPP